MPPPTAPAYGVVVPVKPPRVAKSRLAPLGDEVRRRLVVAFATDTVMAALRTPEVRAVMVVTDDHLLARGMADHGAHVIPDGVADDLNASLVQGAAETARRWPGVRLAALCADLPALRPAELSAALRAAGDRMSFVADADGTGTTAYFAPDVADFDPRFGAGSRAAHLAAGGTEILEPGLVTLRRDVDTTDDLRHALELGVGTRTSSVVTALGLHSSL
jgi:2-phospho-L-lactate guanylyltransferase